MCVHVSVGVGIVCVHVPVGVDVVCVCMCQ